ncbi:hypothetical protein DPMN_035252 [Dreissena polymorpha]|uniref:Uncharacterized protein n=1 Tax=Dreissena polymorpha TaxID=45954 RepID=A0A9D4RKU8_DREPO|nr:hypothetical protein DPMN_035252 [Dreissena polymorpha]
MTSYYPQTEIHFRKECRYIRRRFLLYQRHLYRLYRRCICGIAGDMSYLQYNQARSPPDTEPGCEVHYNSRCGFTQERHVSGTYILTRACNCLVSQT